MKSSSGLLWGSLRLRKVPGGESALTPWLTSRLYGRSKVIHTNKRLNGDIFSTPKEQLLYVELKFCNFFFFLVLNEYWELKIVPKPFNISRSQWLCVDSAHLNCTVYIKKKAHKNIRLKIYHISVIKLHKGYWFPINFSIPCTRRQQGFTQLTRCSLKDRVIRNKRPYLRFHSGRKFCSFFNWNPRICSFLFFTFILHYLSGTVLWYSFLLP